MSNADTITFSPGHEAPGHDENVRDIFPYITYSRSRGEGTEFHISDILPAVVDSDSAIRFSKLLERISQQIANNHDRQVLQGMQDLISQVSVDIPGNLLTIRDANGSVREIVIEEPESDIQPLSERDQKMRELKIMANGLDHVIASEHAKRYPNSYRIARVIKTLQDLQGQIG